MVKVSVLDSLSVFFAQADKRRVTLANQTATASRRLHGNVRMALLNTANYLRPAALQPIQATANYRNRIGGRSAVQ